jgi:hypothetical protein
MFSETFRYSFKSSPIEEISVSKTRLTNQSLNFEKLVSLRDKPRPLNRYGRRKRNTTGQPEAAGVSVAWKCPAGWGKVGPLECPESKASGRARVERLDNI